MSQSASTVPSWQNLALAFSAYTVPATPRWAHLATTKRAAHRAPAKSRVQAPRAPGRRTAPARSLHAVVACDRSKMKSSLTFLLVVMIENENFTHFLVRLAVMVENEKFTHFFIGSIDAVHAACG